MRPTIHLTNASSRKLHHGHVYNIMAKPRRWERFEGTVLALRPRLANFRRFREGLLPFDGYRGLYLSDAQYASRLGLLDHGRLVARNFDGKWIVEDDDTLVCACSKDAAARGECHRAWAASFLHAAGWRVVLDGEAFAP